ncbi:uncharacterized protein LOC141682924 [Apium graveolens]|uniref:uncharacterized protein LOC141682924 n=1 Tax=Apium graveolens TaxID=4045 RepID=UPI003D796653
MFIAKYGDRLTIPFEVLIDKDNTTTLDYSHSDRKIHRLHSFFEEYMILKDYIIVFRYLGMSKFRLEVFNSGNIKDYGAMLVHNPKPENGSSESITETEGSESSGTSSDDMSNIEDDLVPLDEESLSFVVVLCDSHVDRRCHGVEICMDLWPVYSQWGYRSNTTLVFRGRRWTVQALCVGRRCQFGIRWVAFTVENRLAVNDELLFFYMGNFTFEVLLLD